MGNQAALMKALMCVLIAVPMISANQTMCNTTVMGPNCNGTIYNQRVTSDQKTIILNELNKYRTRVARASDTQGNPRSRLLISNMTRLGISSQCSKGTFKNGVSAVDQATIMKKFNEMGNKVALGQETRGSNGPQRSAGNMRKLSWDPELASIAQRWADQCQYGHDKCRGISRFPGVGQTIIQTRNRPYEGAMESDWPAAINAWFDEVDKLNNINMPSFRGNGNPNAVTGHYTQGAWAETSLIGCGFGTNKSGDRCSHYYVCNYGTGGNVTGSPRASCPNSPLGASFPGLC